MKLNKEGLKALHDREGLRLKPYLDTQGIATIALGNTYYIGGRKVTMQDKALTLKEAQDLGQVVADDFAKYVDSLVKSIISQNQFNALVSLCYNIGKDGFKKSTVLRLVNQSPANPRIAEAFMMWTKNKELIGRRKTEVKQYFS